MDCVHKYGTTKSLKQFVLVPAVRDLTERADFEVEQRDLKRGRRITGFEFILRERSQGDVFPHDLEV